MKEKQIFLVLHNLRSVYNAGSIFRTADAAGVSKIFLTGYTPRPTDRFGRPRKDFLKVSLGAESAVPWEFRRDIGVFLKELKRDKIQCIAVEQAGGSVDYRKVKVKKKAAFIFGNELRGISPNVLKHCDLIAEIPMRGKKESLNVSVAAGIALFRMLRI